LPTTFPKVPHTASKFLALLENVAPDWIIAWGNTIAYFGNEEKVY
jgi:hypothetical protein